MMIHGGYGMRNLQATRCGSGDKSLGSVLARLRALIDKLRSPRAGASSFPIKAGRPQK